MPEMCRLLSYKAAKWTKYGAWPTTVLAQDVASSHKNRTPDQEG